MQKCILVVDDDAMNLRRTKMILEKQQYGVILAESGEKALQKLAGEKGEGGVRGVGGGGGEGIGALEHMKGKYDDIPVIFLTASGYEDDVMSAIRLGAVNYLKKPFLPQDLLDRIAKEFEIK